MALYGVGQASAPPMLIQTASRYLIAKLAHACAGQRLETRDAARGNLKSTERDLSIRSNGCGDEWPCMYQTGMADWT
jgi:hypothetical protein